VPVLKLALSKVVLFGTGSTVFISLVERRSVCCTNGADGAFRSRAPRRWRTVGQCPENLAPSWTLAAELRRCRLGDAVCRRARPHALLIRGPPAVQVAASRPRPRRALQATNALSQATCGQTDRGSPPNLLSGHPQRSGSADPHGNRRRKSLFFAREPTIEMRTLPPRSHAISIDRYTRSTIYLYGGSEFTAPAAAQA
jgi:hypothetical protein